MAKPEGYDEAVKAAEAYQTPRFKRLKELENWVNGTQYDGRPNWWTGGANEVPLWERAPCYVFPAVRNAIASNVDLVLGEGRFPSITSRPDEDESDDSDDSNTGTDDDQSDSLDRFIREYHKASRFKSHLKEAFATAQASGTAVAIHGHRNGKPFCDLVPARWCTPKLDAKDNVLELDIKYTYIDESKGADGKWRAKAMLFRRLITESKDITFHPAEARVDGIEPKWVANPALTIEHSLGFCPVVWYPFMRGCQPVHQIDGKPIHLGLTSEIEALDVALSLKHRVALYSEPQIVETGVDPEHNPSGEMGREAMIPSTEHGGVEPGHELYSGDDPGAMTGAYVAPQRTPKAARKKGATFVWRYSDPNTKVYAIDMPSEVMKNLDEHCTDLLSKLEESLAVVLPRPQNFKFAGAISGKSLIETKRRQFDRCDQFRDDLEDNFILPSVSMQLRIAQRARDTLRVPGITDALPILDSFALESTQPNAQVGPLRQA